MNFYISWSRSDPSFFELFPKCNLLMSPINLLKNFKLSHWRNQPQQIIIDSNAYHFISKKQIPLQKYIFKKQLKIIEGVSSPTLMCPLDYPLANKSGITKTFYAIEKTISNAYEFMELFHYYKLDQCHLLQPMGIIQGNSKESIHFCAQELKRLGFKTFALGSLAALYHYQEIIKRVKYTIEIVGAEKLHILGISNLTIMKDLIKFNVRSTDSSRPTKAAIYNGIFYSNPFRIYGIAKAINSDKYSKTLTSPLPCECPICRENPSIILLPGLKKGVNARAIHNYYHLLQHLDSIKKETLSESLFI